MKSNVCPLFLKILCLTAFVSFFAIQTECQAMSKNVEVQAEYVQHRMFDDRFINNYNLHHFQKAHEHAGLT
ncbi:MAG: hypothetical protein IJV18_00870, partial [Acidaminococcaceae bacterium]|nr:hypothetical protein [Acidaminococcaceae bacterium]